MKRLLKQDEVIEFTPTELDAVDYNNKTNFELNGQSIQVEMKDTDGQERFRTITSSFYR